MSSASVPGVEGSTAVPDAAVAPALPPDPCRLDQASPEPVLCVHCGRTSSNGIVCQGICVADSGY
ncbi:MAG: hypothetical protein VKO44_09920 [Cyanobacteriota bacterium]|nr:hypothetical protein [Cyanobacteriota bacterium]